MGVSLFSVVELLFLQEINNPMIKNGRANNLKKIPVIFF
jgi:hypothetical protein